MANGIDMPSCSEDVQCKKDCCVQVQGEKGGGACSHVHVTYCVLIDIRSSSMIVSWERGALRRGWGPARAPVASHSASQHIALHCVSTLIAFGDPARVSVASHVWHHTASCTCIASQHDTDHRMIQVRRGWDLLAPMETQEAQMLRKEPRWRLSCRAVVGDLDSGDGAEGGGGGEVEIRVRPDLENILRRTEAWARRY